MRFTLLPFIGLACAATPSLTARQNSTDIDYGFWNFTYTSESVTVGYYRNFDAVYYNPGHSAPVTIKCVYSYIRGSERDECSPPTVKYSVGGPWDPTNSRITTFNITQTVSLDGGEPTTLYGTNMVEIQSGLGSGRASRAVGSIQAGVEPVNV